MPPPHVVRFLEDPSEENGMAYLAVQIKKNAKMMRAQQVLARLRKRLQEPHEHPHHDESGTVAPKEPATSIRAPSAGSAHILYFKSDT